MKDIITYVGKFVCFALPVVRFRKQRHFSERERLCLPLNVAKHVISHCSSYSILLLNHNHNLCVFDD